VESQRQFVCPFKSVASSAEDFSSVSTRPGQHFGAAGEMMMMMLRNDVIALRSLCFRNFLFALVSTNNRDFSEKLR
jgi:hypothetical protein